MPRGQRPSTSYLFIVYGASSITVSVHITDDLSNHENLRNETPKLLVIHDESKSNRWIGNKPKMELETSDLAYTGTEDHHIPTDLFGSKKHAGVPRGILSFADASGNIVFKVHRQPPNPTSSSSLLKDTKLLLDGNDNLLFSIHRHHDGCWKCYKGRGDGEKELVFGVKRNVKTLTRVELEVTFAGERLNDDVHNLKVIGSPFKRSCNIYKDTDLVAQSSLMYKLNQIYVSRGKFRLTIFPGTIDRALIVALFVIFLNGRK